jgi:hypothetical protein
VRSSFSNFGTDRWLIKLSPLNQQGINFYSIHRVIEKGFSLIIWLCGSETADLSALFGFPKGQQMNTDQVEKIKMKRLALATVGVLLCLASGYSLNRFVLGIEATVSQELGNICSPQTVAEDFRLLGSRKRSHKTIVVYRVNCHTKNRFPPETKNQLGYKIVARKGIGWQLVGGGEHLEVLPQSPGELVQYGTSRNPNHQDRQAIIYGEILSPTVAAVEATFDNDKTLHDKGKGGIFVLAIPEAVGPREVRVLGTNGQTLQRDNKSLTTVYMDKFLTNVYPSSEDTVRDAVEEPHSQCLLSNRILGDFRILRTIEYSQGALVFYREICRNSASSILSAQLYVSVLYKENTDWQKTKVSRSRDSITYDIDPVEYRGSVWRLTTTNFSAGYMTSPIDLASRSLVWYSLASFRAAKGKNSARDYTYISGRALTPEVVAVETTFSTGQNLRDRVTNGVFGMILPRATGIVELRVLGANGQVLQRDARNDNVLKLCPNLGEAVGLMSCTHFESQALP